MQSDLLGNIEDAKLHQVATAELRVDREVEQDEVPVRCRSCRRIRIAQMSRSFSGAFRPTSLPSFQGCRCWVSIEVSSRDFEGAPPNHMPARRRSRDVYTRREQAKFDPLRSLTTGRFGDVWLREWG